MSRGRIRIFTFRCPEVGLGFCTFGCPGVGLELELVCVRRSVWQCPEVGLDVRVFAMFPASSTGPKEEGAGVLGIRVGYEGEGGTARRELPPKER